MIRQTTERLYETVQGWSQHPKATLILTIVSFFESIIFPIPPDALMIPLCLAQPKKSLWYGFWCTVGSVLGACVGYGIGYFIFDHVGQFIIDLYSAQDAFNRCTLMYHKWGVWIVLAGGLTPIPFKLITLTSGLVSLPFPLFIVTAIGARGLRFMLLSWIFRTYGAAIDRCIKKNIVLFSAIFIILLIGGFVIILR
jgi:membrane protein YqaA with SNARE-associated domain